MSLQTIFYEDTGNNQKKLEWWEKYVNRTNAGNVLKMRQSQLSPRSMIAPAAPSPRSKLSPRAPATMTPRRAAQARLQPLQSPRKSNYPPVADQPFENYQQFFPGRKASQGGKNFGPSMTAKPGAMDPSAIAANAPSAEDQALIDAQRAAEKEAEEKRLKQARELRAAAEQKIHVKFGNIKKAFKYLDVDNSGKIGITEFKKFLSGQNIDVDDDNVKHMLDLIDTNKDGEIEYDEFVDHLSRETVAIAAMGKRGMQSKEAMGVSAFELLDEQLKTKKDKFAPKFKSEKQRFEESALAAQE